MHMPGYRTMKSFKFLFTGPLILVMLFVINLMTSPGEWWVQWAALGIGIAWVLALLRVIRAIVVAGGLAALGYFLWSRQAGTPPPQGGASRPPDIPTVPLAKE
jgi:hypothetical protein